MIMKAIILITIIMKIPILVILTMMKIIAIMMIRLRQDTGGRGDDTVGNPHRAQTSRFEQFEATASQSTVPSPPLRLRRDEDGPDHMAHPGAGDAARRRAYNSTMNMMKM